MLNMRNVALYGCMSPLIQFQKNTVHDLQKWVEQLMCGRRSFKSFEPWDAVIQDDTQPALTEFDDWSGNSIAFRGSYIEEETGNVVFIDVLAGLFFNKEFISVREMYAYHPRDGGTKYRVSQNGGWCPVHKRDSQVTQKLYDCLIC